MRKIVLSVVMCCALLASSAVMAQDTKKVSKKAKTETSKECTEKKDCPTDKKDCPADKKEAKKSCCSSDKK